MVSAEAAGLLAEEVCLGALVDTPGSVPQVLLLHRSPDRSNFLGQWDVPGGHVEPGETVEETLVRELGEEIAVRPKKWQLLGQVTTRTYLGLAPLIVNLFVITDWEGLPENRQSDEHDQLTWFPLDEARQRLADWWAPNLIALLP